MKKIRKLIIPILIVLITYFSGTVWQVTEGNSIFTYALILVSIILLINMSTNKKTVLYPKESVSRGFLFLLFLMVFTYMTHVSKENYNYYIFSIIIILFSYLFVLNINFLNFQKLFNYVLVSITIFSLINYVILNYTPYDLNFGQLISENNVVYNKGFLSYYMYSIDRNIAIFWEPGVFASVLVFGIVLQVLSKKVNYFTIIVYLLGILSTKSSAGLLLIIPVTLLLIIENNHKQMNKLIFSSIFLVISLVFLILNYEQILSDTVFIKLLEFDLSDTRIQTIKYNLELFASRPILGHGFTYVNEITKQAISSTNIELMQTSTTTYYLASSGIIGMGYTFLWIIGIIKIRGVRSSTKVLLIIIFMSILNKEVHATIVITQILMFYLLRFNYDNEELNYGKHTTKYQLK